MDHCEIGWCRRGDFIQVGRLNVFLFLVILDCIIVNEINFYDLFCIITFFESAILHFFHRIYMNLDKS